VLGSARSHLYLLLRNWLFYQFLTLAFCHGSFAHMSGNIFMIYVFGRLVEEEEGTMGVVATYAVTAVGARSVASSTGGGGSIARRGGVRPRCRHLRAFAGLAQRAHPGPPSQV
jgi:membrane associated rhomboid family serine protease